MLVFWHKRWVWLVMQGGNKCPHILTWMFQSKLKEKQSPCKVFMRSSRQRSKRNAKIIVWEYIPPHDAMTGNSGCLAMDLMLPEHFPKKQPNSLPVRNKSRKKNKKSIAHNHKCTHTKKILQLTAIYNYHSSTSANVIYKISATLRQSNRSQQ